MNLITNKEDIRETLWRDLLHHSPYASPFQTPEIFALYQSMDGIGADVFAVEEGGEFQALVLVTVQQEQGIKRRFSRRGIVYGGPLLRRCEAQDTFSFLLSQMEAYYRRKLIYLEIRHSFDYTSLIEADTTSDFSYQPWLNFQFDQLNRQSFKEQMAKTRLRQLNKALRQGVAWRPAQDENDVIAFYAILSELYRHKVKKPLPPLEFFLHFFRSSLAQFLVVLNGEDVIGGVMCLYIEGGAMYEYYICGLDREYPSHYPSTMAMWAMVSMAEDLGIQRLDLMGAGQPSCPSGVREYKRKFGGQMVEHGRYLMVFKPFWYRLGRFVILRWNALKTIS